MTTNKSGSQMDQGHTPIRFNKSIFIAVVLVVVGLALWLLPILEGK